MTLNLKAFYSIIYIYYVYTEFQTYEEHIRVAFYLFSFLEWDVYSILYVGKQMEAFLFRNLRTGVEWKIEIKAMWYGSIGEEW
jgi:hypothetical protein